VKNTPMNSDQIIRQLRVIRYSSRSSRQRGPSIAGIARHAGITRAAIYLMMQTGSTGKSHDRLSAALEQCKGERRERSTV
jgi:hypothetical protein